MESYIENIENGNRMNVLIWMSEFSEMNYELCKEIILNIDDKNIVKENGKNIYLRGGMCALISCFYIMSNFMCNNKNEKEKMSLINCYWNGIGEWEW
jgi:hypothetical protein